jgi:hypothetical protein
VARAMISALYPEIVPSSSAALVPGRSPPRAPPPGGGRLHGQQLIGGGLADLGQLLRRERLDVLVLVLLLLAVALVPLAQPVQRRLALGRGHRVAVQPGEVVVWPGVRGNR